jgi:hypothetical protein
MKFEFSIVRHIDSNYLIMQGVLRSFQMPTIDQPLSFQIDFEMENFYNVCIEALPLLFVC